MHLQTRLLFNFLKIEKNFKIYFFIVNISYGMRRTVLQFVAENVENKKTQEISGKESVEILEESTIEIYNMLRWMHGNEFRRYLEKLNS